MAVWCVLLVIVSACGESSTDEQVAQLKTELSEANNRVAELEKELAGAEEDNGESVTTTSAAAATTTSEPKAEGGTRANPLPLGTEAVLDEWNVSVVSVDLDAGPEMAATNQFNDPAPDGSVYVLVRLRATYTGPSEGAAWLGLEVEIIGDDQRRNGSGSCDAVPPDSLVDQPDVLTGGTVEGNECVAIPVGLGSPLVAVSESLSFEDSEVWFATS